MCGENLTIDQDTLVLHPCQDRDQRQFNIIEQLKLPHFVQSSLQRLLDPQRDVGVLARIKRRLLQRDRGELPVLPSDRLVGEHFVPQIETGDLLQVVPPLLRPGKVRRDHRVEGEP